MCSCALVVDLLAFWMFAMCMWAYVLTNVYLVCCHCKSKEFQLFNFYLQLKIRHTQFPIMPIDDDNLFRWIKLLMRFGLVCVYAYTIRSLVANLYMYLLRWMSMFRSKKDASIHPNLLFQPQLLLHIFDSLSLHSTMHCLDILDRECIIKSQCII